MTFNCPRCSQLLEAQDGMAGQEAQCHQCKNTIRIPARPGTPPPAPSDPSVLPPIAPPFPPPKTSGMAIASMTLGISGLVFGWCCCGPLLSILAIILGHVSFSRISRQPQAFTGKGMAIAGFVTGYVGLAVGLMAMLLFGVWALMVGTLFGGMANALQQMPK